MQTLQVFDLQNLGAPIEGVPKADRLIEGNPTFKTWTVTSVNNDQVRSGVWEATPGTYLSIKGGIFEYCTILSGLVELTEEGGTPVTLKAGDTFVMKPDFVGTWRTIETVRKLWVTVEPV